MSSNNAMKFPEATSAAPKAPPPRSRPKRESAQMAMTMMNPKTKAEYLISLEKMFPPIKSKKKSKKEDVEVNDKEKNTKKASKGISSARYTGKKPKKKGGAGKSAIKNKPAQSFWHGPQRGSCHSKTGNSSGKVKVCWRTKGNRLTDDAASTSATPSELVGKHYDLVGKIESDFASTIMSSLKNGGSESPGTLGLKEAFTSALEASTKSTKATAMESAVLKGDYSFEKIERGALGALGEEGRLGMAGSYADEKLYKVSYRSCIEGRGYEDVVEILGIDLLRALLEVAYEVSSEKLRPNTIGRVCPKALWSLVYIYNDGLVRSCSVDEMLRWILPQLDWSHLERGGRSRTLSAKAIENLRQKKSEEGDIDYMKAHSFEGISTTDKLSLAVENWYLAKSQATSSTDAKPSSEAKHLRQLIFRAIVILHRMIGYSKLDSAVPGTSERVTQVLDSVSLCMVAFSFCEGIDACSELFEYKKIEEEDEDDGGFPDLFEDLMACIDEAMETTNRNQLMKEKTILIILSGVGYCLDNSIGMQYSEHKWDGMRFLFHASEVIMVMAVPPTSVEGIALGVLDTSASVLRANLALALPDIFEGLRETDRIDHVDIAAGSAELAMHRLGTLAFHMEKVIGTEDEKCFRDTVKSLSSVVKTTHKLLIEVYSREFGRVGDASSGDARFSHLLKTVD